MASVDVVSRTIDLHGERHKLTVSDFGAAGPRNRDRRFAVFLEVSGHGELHVSDGSTCAQALDRAKVVFSHYTRVLADISEGR